MAAVERPEFFSAAWWDAAAEAWNTSGHTASLARFRTAAFRVTDTSSPPVWMHWDDAGVATRGARGRADDPEFSASLQNWREFFEGRFTAGMAVLRFKIHFRGPVRRVLPYTRGLNAFGRAARPLL